jgi:putative ABC transport system permease protein
MRKWAGTWRLIESDLRHRPRRAWALVSGLLVASTSFALLTAAVGTSQARVQGTVRSSFRAAYDLLVRPSTSANAAEQQRGVVPDNFGSGLFGGISLDEYHQIEQVTGVDVAAPVANIGYVMPTAEVDIPVDAYLTSDPVQLFRVHVDETAQRGLSTYPASDYYVYYTRTDPFSTDPQRPGLALEQTPTGTLEVCQGVSKAISAAPTRPATPFDQDPVQQLDCFSARTAQVRQAAPGLATGPVGVGIYRQYPLLLAAVDPAAEAKLLGADRSVVSGRFLRADDATRRQDVPLLGSVPTVPVIANNTTYLDNTLHVQIQRLNVNDPAAVPGILASTQAPNYLTGLTGQVLASQDRPAAMDYPGLLDAYSQSTPRVAFGDFSEYRQAGPVTYDPRGLGLAPRPTSNPDSVWQSFFYEGYPRVPAENADTAFRALTSVQGINASGGGLQAPTVQVVGRFDPSKLPGFNPLSQVPLETYYPPQVTGADAASRNALGNQPLLPDANLAGYLTQPPAMLTTLAAAQQSFWNRSVYANAPKAPISYIRVRVAGVSGPDKVSLARIDAVAAAIHQRTGLTVDITAGSSPAPQTVSLPAGKFGRPALNVSEGWVAKGVAVRFLTAVDRKSLLLFLLVLVVCLFFLANAAVAAERSRRTDLGVLCCLGWSRRQLFGYVTGQQALVGLVAGMAGTGLAAGLVAGLGLQFAWWHLALITPTAVLLACLAGLTAALRATRVSPLDAVQPPVARLRRVHRVRGPLGLAVANVRRSPGRALTGAAALFVAVAGLTIVLAVTRAFRNSLVGNLLGNAVSLQVRGVDYLAVGLMVVLAGLSLADVVYLNVAERGDEIAVLSAVGWRPGQLRALFGAEALLVAATGSVAGAAAGLGVVAGLTPLSPTIEIAAAGAALTGIVVAGLVMLVPLSQISRRLPALQFAAAE